MARLAIPSDYGPLRLPEIDSDFPEINLPQMQFEDADVIIKLGSKPEEWLLLHSSVLRASSAYFDRSLSQQWDHSMSGSTKILHPNTGQQVSMRCRALQYIDGTYLVEGQDFTSGTHENVMLFSESILALPGWPKIRYFEDVKDRSKRALHILFALLYGARLDCHQICATPKSNWNSIDTDDLNEDAFFTIAATCAYAEYYGCLDVVGPGALAILQSASSYWQAVGEQPVAHLEFAVKVQNTELYYDALRHSAVKSYETDDWQVLSELTGTSEGELLQFYGQALARQGPLAYDDRLRKLTDDLRFLQLQQVHAKPYMESWQKVRTRLLDIVFSMRNSRLEHTRDDLAVQYLVGAIWGEYIAYMLQGQELRPGADCVRASKAGNILHLFHNIQQAANREDPSSLFDAAASVHFAAVFRFSGSQQRDLKICLQKLVLQADRLIRDAFPVEIEMKSYAGQSQLCTKSRTKCANFSGRHSAYLSVPDETPWMHNTGATMSSGNGKVIVDGISVVDASPEWIATLAEHFGGDVEDEDDEEVEVEVEDEIGFEHQEYEDDGGVDW